MKRGAIHHTLASRVTAEVNARGHEAVAAEVGVTVEELRRAIMQGRASQAMRVRLAVVCGVSDEGTT